MLIRYKGELVEVEYINSDTDDPDMPLCVRFPEGHSMRDDNENDGTVWLQASSYSVIKE